MITTFIQRQPVNRQPTHTKLQNGQNNLKDTTIHQPNKKNQKEMAPRIPLLLKTKKHTKLTKKGAQLIDLNLKKSCRAFLLHTKNNIFELRV